MDIVQRQTTSSRWFQVKARRYVQQTNIQTGASKTRYPSPTSAWPVSSSNTHIYIFAEVLDQKAGTMFSWRESAGPPIAAPSLGAPQASPLSTHRSIYTRNKEKKKTKDLSLYSRPETEKHQIRSCASTDKRTSQHKHTQLQQQSKLGVA